MKSLKTKEAVGRDNYLIFDNQLCLFESNSFCLFDFYFPSNIFNEKIV